MAPRQRDKSVPVPVAGPTAAPLPIGSGWPFRLPIGSGRFRVRFARECGTRTDGKSRATPCRDHAGQPITEFAEEPGIGDRAQIPKMAAALHPVGHTGVGHPAVTCENPSEGDIRITCDGLVILRSSWPPDPGLYDFLPGHRPHRAVLGGLCKTCLAGWREMGRCGCPAAGDKRQQSGRRAARTEDDGYLCTL
jgi:hypothetical protein